MKNGKKVVFVALGLALLASPVWAVTDYSGMSNEDLAAVRGTMSNATSEERTAFQSEWQSRVQQMTPEERQQAVSRPENAPADGTGSRYGAGNGQGTGDGSRTRGGGMGCMGGGGRR